MVYQLATKVHENHNHAAGWIHHNLDEKIIEIKSGFAFNRKNAINSQGIPHLRPFNVDSNGEINLSQIIYIPKDYKKSLNEYYLLPGDILFNNTNSVELVGKSAIVRNHCECAFSNHITRIRIVNPAKLDPSWLLVCLRVLWLSNFFANNCNRWIGQAGFNSKKLGEIKIPLPSIGIQRAIVSRIEANLNELKVIRSNIERMRENAKQMLNIALDGMCQSITSNRQLLIDVINSKPRNGWSPKCDNNPNGIPVLKLGAVLRFRFNPNEIKRTSEPVNWNSHYWLNPGDILISRSNTPELVGNAAIYSGEPSPCIYPDLMMKMTVNESKADSRFLIYWFQTQEVREYIKSHASGASSTMKKITQSDVCNIPFPDISLQEQVYLSSYLNSIQNELDEIIKFLDKDTKSLDELEQSILERAFRGEL